MNRHRLAIIAVLLFFCGRANADPIAVQSVRVTMGGFVFDSAYVGWDLPVTLQAGENLILAQHWTGTPNDRPPDGHGPCSGCSFNFDGSEYPGTAPTVQFDLNGVTHSFVDATGVLTGAGKEGRNETTDWLLGYTSGDLQVWLGYADNSHPGVCDAPGCFPSGFFTPSYLQYAAGYLPPGNPEPEHGRCQFGASDPFCIDSSVLMFVNADRGRGVDPPPVPEPATLALLGIGLAVLVGMRARQ